jgi:hypothetical protein
MASGAHPDPGAQLVGWVEHGELRQSLPRQVAHPWDAAMSYHDGFRFPHPSYVLALRAEIEQPGATLPPPDRYLDLSYYDRPLARVGK